MSNASMKKVYIQIESVAEQEVSATMSSLELCDRVVYTNKEHLKSQRKTLKVLQAASTDKENLVGRPELDKLSRLKAATETTLASTDYAKRKKIECRAVHTQTSPVKQAAPQAITAEDLTSEAKPGEHYWERLAEKRREALEETLVENRNLHERIEGLEAELNTSRLQLEEAHNLVSVLTEMLNENEDDKDEATDPDADTATACSEQEQQQQHATNN